MWSHRLWALTWNGWSFRSFLLEVVPNVRLKHWNSNDIASFVPSTTSSPYLFVFAETRSPLIDEFFPFGRGEQKDTGLRWNRRSRRDDLWVEPPEARMWSYGIRLRRTRHRNSVILLLKMIIYENRGAVWLSVNFLLGFGFAVAVFSTAAAKSSAEIRGPEQICSRSSAC